MLHFRQNEAFTLHNRQNEVFMVHDRQNEASSSYRKSPLLGLEGLRLSLYIYIMPSYRTERGPLLPLCKRAPTSLFYYLSGMMV